MSNYLIMQSPWTREEVYLIQKFARELGVQASEITGEWIESYAVKYRELFDMGIHSPLQLEELLYSTEEVQSNYKDMVALIITQ